MKTCTISDGQKQIIRGITSQVIKQSPKEWSAEKVTKQVYNVLVDKMLTQSSTKEFAYDYAYAYTKHIVPFLQDIRKEVFSEDVEKLEKDGLPVSLIEFPEKEIVKLSTEEGFREAIGRTVPVPYVPSSVTMESVQKHLDNIEKAFPKITSNAKYAPITPMKGVNRELTYDVISTAAGEVRLTRVTEVVRKEVSTATSDTANIIAGNIVDRLVRNFFRNPKDYEEFKKDMFIDDKIRELFKTFSNNPKELIPVDEDVKKRVVEDEEMSQLTDLQLNYLNEIIDNTIILINKIRNEFPDSYITDLSKDEKTVRLYSQSMGIVGELDLLAIKPDGTYTVIDIKLTNKYTSIKGESFALQTSYYDNALSNVPGLKSSGKTAAFVVNYFITETHKDATGLKQAYRLSLSLFSKKEFNTISEDKLKERRNSFEEIFKKHYEKIQPSTIRAATRRKLFMSFSDKEPIASEEDLDSYVEWVEERFPELKGRVNIIRSINSSNGAEMLMDAINFYSKVNKGAHFHEGWHRFSQFYLTKQEKTALYKAVQDAEIPFTSRDGRKMNTKDASFFHIEEFLAEEFRKFAKNPSAYNLLSGVKYSRPENKKVKNIFQKMWDFLKRLFGFYETRGEQFVIELFQNLYNNSFSRNNYSSDNVFFNKLASLFKGQEMSNEMFIELRNLSDTRISQFLSENGYIAQELANEKGIKETIRPEIYKSLELYRDILSDELSVTEDKKGKSGLQIAIDAIDSVIKDGQESKIFGDFVYYYMKYSQFKTFNVLSKDYSEEIRELLLEEVEIDKLIAENTEGDISEEFDEANSKDGDFNNPGNKYAIHALASDEILDFFVGIRRVLPTVSITQRDTAMLAHKNYTSEEDIRDARNAIFDFTKSGFPETLSPREAFYKTLELVNGAISIDDIIKRLENPENFAKFPEAFQIIDRLIGTSESSPYVKRGLIPRMREMKEKLDINSKIVDKVKYDQLLKFLFHFESLFQSTFVDSDNFIINKTVESTFTESGNEVKATAPAVYTIDNEEAIIYSIIDEFSRGFQTNSAKDTRKKVSIYDLLSDIFIQKRENFSEESIKKALGSDVLLYDYVYQTYYFNPFSLEWLKTRTSLVGDEILNLFKTLGVNLNENIVLHSKNIDIINRRVLPIIKNVMEASQKLLIDRAVTLYNDNYNDRSVPNIKALLAERKAIIQKINEKSVDTPRLSVQLVDIEEQLKPYVSRLFYDNPVNKILLDGKDPAILSVKRYRPMASAFRVFKELAKIQKSYHKNFSSGSLIVGEDRSWGYFRPSLYSHVSNLLNNHVVSFSDFAKYPSLSHLDPIKNPAILNSYIFSNIFNPFSGEKSDTRGLGLSTIGVVHIIDELDTGAKVIENFNLVEQDVDKKLLVDILMSLSEGWTETRRVEISTSSWRVGLVDKTSGQRRFIKPVDNLESFSDVQFTNRVWAYIQHAAWGYKYYQDNPDEAGQFKQSETLRNNLGVFDKMIPNSVKELKEFIKSFKGDLNTLSYQLKVDNPTLYYKIESEINDYFEGVAFSNEDAYSKEIYKILSNNSLKALDTISNINSEANRRLMGITTREGNEIRLTKKAVIDIIANDFIQVMEDSILFFGEYHYYADPLKRRKIVANNGSIALFGETVSEFYTHLMNVSSHQAIWNQINKDAKNKGKDRYDLIRKIVIQDKEAQSSLLTGNQLVKNLQQVFKDIYGLELTEEQIKEDPMYTSSLKGLEKMKLADAAGWINPDTARLMRMKDSLWSEEASYEFQRQMILFKYFFFNRPQLSDEEKTIMSRTHSKFSALKDATTGPVYHEEGAPYQPVFDKMGLRMLLAEFDADSEMRDLFLKMISQGIDYAVMDTGSKVYVKEKLKLVDENGFISVPKTGAQLSYSEHAGAFHKLQLNTTTPKSSVKYAVQLRALMSEIIQIVEELAPSSDNKFQKLAGLKKTYSKYIGNLVELIGINSSSAMSRMGLSSDGRILDKALFADYIRERLLENNIEIEDELVKLDTNLDGTFINYLEALPFQKEIADLLVGIIDDNFREIEISGSGLVQTSEVGTGGIKYSYKLKPISLKYDKNGKVTGINPWEAKISFRKEFYSLLDLEHPDGKKIRDIGITKENFHLRQIFELRRLNEALRDEEWRKKNEEALTFMGIRLPFQALNFGGPMTIVEFLPESMGDVIVLPPEFYVFSGADNDIDKIITQFPQLKNGKLIKKDEKGYFDLIKELEEVTQKIEEESTQSDENIQSTDVELSKIKDAFKEKRVYTNRGWTEDELDEDLTLLLQDGVYEIAGLSKGKSKLATLVKKSIEPELIEQLYEYLDRKNSKSKPTSDLKSKQLDLRKRVRLYKKGVLNDILSTGIDYWTRPEMFLYLVTSDSTAKLEKFGSSIQSLVQGKDVKVSDSRPPLDPSDNLKLVKNYDDHGLMRLRALFLGKAVKSRSVLPNLAYLGYPFPAKYQLGSFKDMAAHSGMFTVKKGNVYEVVTSTPLLYKNPEAEGFRVTLYDENGGYISKIFQEIASAAIDSINKPEVLPSLRVAPMSLDAWIFLLFQGVPNDRILTFLNTPVVQEIHNLYASFGQSAMPKHAIIQVAKDIQFFGDYTKKLLPEDVDIYDQDNNFNFMLKSPAAYFGKYLGRDEKLDETQMTEFTRDYVEYKGKKKDATLVSFLQENPKYADLAKAIVAYYGIINQTGTAFYSSMITRLDRASSKMGTRADLQRVVLGDAIRLGSNFSTPEFEEKLKNESIYSMFYKDKQLAAILDNRTPELFRGNIPLMKRYDEIVKDVLLDTRGSQVEKKRIEEKILVDFMDNIVKNFYVTRIGNSVDTIYNLFKFDITPLWRLADSNQQRAKESLRDVLEGKDFKDLPEHIKISKMMSSDLFSEQIDIFKAKYPELRDLKIFSLLSTEISHPIIFSKKRDTLAEKLNALPQYFLKFNINSDPVTRSIEERTIREDFEKLIDFDISLYPEINDFLSEDRMDVYNNGDNIAEIREFIRVLSLRLVAQSSILHRGGSSFSHLIPFNLKKHIIETSIDNFHRYLEYGTVSIPLDAKAKAILLDQFMDGFKKAFRAMNPDIEWYTKQTVWERKSEEKRQEAMERMAEEGEEITEDYSPYNDIDQYIENPMGEDFDPLSSFKAKNPRQKEVPDNYYKYYTGAIYGEKGYGSSPVIEQFRSNLAKIMGGIRGVNSFRITKNDNLKC